MNPQIASAALATTTTAFLTFLPSPDALLAGSPTTGLRVNETAAIAVALSVGVALSFAAGEAAPLVFAVIGCVALVAGVEYLSRTNSAALSAENAKGYAPDRMV